MVPRYSDARKKSVSYALVYSGYFFLCIVDGVCMYTYDVSAQFGTGSPVESSWWIFQFRKKESFEEN
jgi:hypothetical protein